MKKKYCINCKAAVNELGFIDTSENAICWHKRNIKKIDTHMRPDRLLSRCAELNKNNDCKHFRQRTVNEIKCVKRFLGIPIKFETIKTPVDWTKEDE